MGAVRDTIHEKLILYIEQKMNPRTLLKGACVYLCMITLVGCTETSSFGGASLQTQYNTARNALEKGNYAAANRAYLRLLPHSGPLQNRLSIELAHSYLRGGDFEQAIATASSVAARSTGNTRSAALSVKGTAEHETAIQLLSNGDTVAGTARMKAAQQSISEVLKNAPNLDPLGALAGRKASIDVRLAALR